MSTPQAKRRRLNEATKTLHKPFKSPFRTPLKPSVGSDPPSSDPPDTSVFATESAYSALSDSNKQPYEQLSTATTATPTTRVARIPNSLVTRRQSIIQPRSVKSAPSKPSVARETMQLRNEIQMLTQAQTLATSTKDDDLAALVDKWRTTSRAVAEELFGSTRDRVNRMGGVGAWKERENESKERQKKWDQEEQEAERERMEEAKENGEVSEEAYDRYAEISEEKVAEGEKEKFQNDADDDSFTMDMMLKTLNIDLQLIGYNKEAQRWDG